MAMPLCTIMGSGCSHGGAYSVDHRLVRVDCSSSVSPLGAPRKAIEAIKRSAGLLVPAYPDPECRDLKKSIARHLGTSTDRIAVGNGAVEVIYWFSRLFAKRRAVVPAPTFCEYEMASKKSGATVTYVPLTPDMRLDPGAVIDSARGADALFLCNPNNPTGLLDTAAIKKIVQDVDSSCRILLDECFIELADGNPEANTLVKMIDEEGLDNLVVLQSLTKSYGMAGLRVGYSVSSAGMASQLADMKIPWNVNGLAQAAGVAALADRQHVARARTLIKKEREYMRKKIAAMESFVPLPSDANYFLVRLKEGDDSAEFRDRLLEKTGVLVRDCSTFTGMGSRHIRVAVKTHRENMLLVKALEEMD
jgi:threonine-phosphate decarboxylase